jgi:hypothetical protein
MLDSRIILSASSSPDLLPSYWTSPYHFARCRCLLATNSFALYISSCINMYSCHRRFLQHVSPWRVPTNIFDVSRCRRTDLVTAVAIYLPVQACRFGHCIRASLQAYHLGHCSRYYRCRRADLATVFVVRPCTMVRLSGPITVSTLLRCARGDPRFRVRSSSVNKSLLELALYMPT